MYVVEDAAARQLHLPAKEGKAGRVRTVLPCTAFRFHGPCAGALHAGLVFSLEFLKTFLKEDTVPGSSRALPL